MTSETQKSDDFILILLLSVQKKNLLKTLGCWVRPNLGPINICCRYEENWKKTLWSGVQAANLSGGSSVTPTHTEILDFQLKIQLHKPWISTIMKQAGHDNYHRDKHGDSLWNIHVSYKKSRTYLKMPDSRQKSLHWFMGTWTPGEQQTPTSHCAWLYHPPVCVITATGTAHHITPAYSLNAKFIASHRFMNSWILLLFSFLYKVHKNNQLVDFYIFI